MFYHLALYLIAFVGIWIGAGLVVSSVERFSHRLKLSSFAVSFLILGFFTSIGEMSVGINSVLEQDPEIFVGNLIGASIVLFMLVIPLLSLAGKNVPIHPQIRGNLLLLSLLVVAAPVILSIDGVINEFDGYVCILSYLFLIISIQTKKGLLEKIKHFRPFVNFKIWEEFLKILFGVGIIFVASRFVVDQTLYFAEVFQVTPFLLSLLVISIGTNVPEISLGIRSLFSNSNQVAFGNYVGSAAFNTFIFGALGLWFGEDVVLTNSYLMSLLFLISGLTLFYFFAKSKNSLSRLEGLVLLVVYATFLGLEIWLH